MPRRRGRNSDVVSSVRSELILEPNCSFCGRRFRAGVNLKRHERVCGDGLANRFCILAVTGYLINPMVMSGVSSWSGQPSTTYVVCDSSEQWTEVGWFEPKGGYTSEHCRRKAESLCRKLNREEQEAELVA